MLIQDASELPAHVKDLSLRAPYDWDTVLGFFGAHQLPYIETVDDSAYERVVSTRRGLGWFRVERPTDHAGVTLSLWNGTPEDLAEISGFVRTMFDLDVDPAAIQQALSGDGFLTRFWAQHPGLRIARAWNAWESMFGAILGQVVSVSFGRVLIAELMRAAGPPARHPKTGEPISLFPSAGQILDADLSTVRTSERRRQTIRLLAKAIEEGRFDRATIADRKELRSRLHDIPGIGAWTAEYIALRAFADDDAFPATDYGLKQELKRHPEINIKAVSPWRGYAAVALWKSFAEAKRSAAPSGE